MPHAPLTPLTEYVRMYFEEGAHPRNPAGSATGGEFTKKKAAPKSAANSGKKRQPQAQPQAQSRPGPRRPRYDPNAAIPFEKRIYKRGVGMSNAGPDDNVKLLQRHLNRLGLKGANGKPLEVDGQLGPQTEAAIKAYQRRTGMKTTGVMTGAELLQVSKTKELPPARPRSRRCMCPTDVCIDERCDQMEASVTATMTPRAADPMMPYGDVMYADPGYQSDGKKRYPLDTAEHCRAAWSYIHQADNAAKYSPAQLKRIKARIRAAGKKHGIEFAPEEGDDGRAGVVDGEYRRVVPDIAVRGVAFEARSAGTDGRTLEGYAAVFGKAARIADVGGDFDEQIRSGAFARSLRTRTPVLQWEHGRDPRVGAVPIGAIEELREDNTGLYVRASLFDNDVVEPVRQAIAAQAVKGMSFRFSVPQGGDAWTPGRDRGGRDLREVRDADVFELGPVVFPAYDTTSVSVRSLLAGLDPAELRELAHELSDLLGRAVDTQTITGRPDARSTGGGDFEDLLAERAASARNTAIESARSRDRELRMQGVLK